MPAISCVRVLVLKDDAIVVELLVRDVINVEVEFVLVLDFLFLVVPLLVPNFLFFCEDFSGVGAKFIIFVC